MNESISEGGNHSHFTEGFTEGEVVAGGVLCLGVGQVGSEGDNVSLYLFMDVGIEVRLGGQVETPSFNCSNVVLCVAAVGHHAR